MATEQEMNAVIDKIKADVNGFIGASLVDMDSGMTLATRSERPDFDLSTASAYNSEMVKLKLKTIHSLGLKSDLEDMLLTLSDQIHLIKLIGKGSFLYLAADRSTTNLAIVRSAVARYIGELA